MKKSVIVSAFVLLFVVVGFFSLVIADSNMTDANQTSYSANPNATNASGPIGNVGNWSVRCAAIDHRVEGLISQYNNSDKRFERFSRLTDLFQGITSRIESRGYNDSLLQDDQLILNNKIAKFQDDYGIFIQKLENTRNFTCGHSEGQFVIALNESRAQLRIVRADAEDIQQFFRTTIKDSIQTIRNQIRADMQANRVARIQNRTANREGGVQNRTVMIERLKNRTAGQTAGAQNGTGDAGGSNVSQ